MREINVSLITDVVERLCIEANTYLPGDVACAIENCRACEDGTIAQGVLDKIIENYQIARNENVPICQDTGMACVFLEIGQDVHLVGGDLREAVDEGVPHYMDQSIHNMCEEALGALIHKRAARFESISEIISRKRVTLNCHKRELDDLTTEYQRISTLVNAIGGYDYE